MAASTASRPPPTTARVRADHVDDQVGGLFSGGQIVLDHVELVWRADVSQQAFQTHLHGPF
jgi:hypothetical protein